MAPSGPVYKTPHYRFVKASSLRPRFAFYPHDDIYAIEFRSNREGGNPGNADIVARNVEQKAFGFDVEVLMRLGVGIEVGMIDIHCALAQKSRIGELMERIINGRE
jgi:hypothetical protein